MTPDMETLEAAKRDSGILCKGCHKVRSWNNLDIRYDIHVDLYRLWICIACGAVVREDNITDYQIQRELDNE